MGTIYYWFVSDIITILKWAIIYKNNWQLLLKGTNSISDDEVTCTFYGDVLGSNLATLQENDFNGQNLSFCQVLTNFSTTK